MKSKVFLILITLMASSLMVSFLWAKEDVPERIFLEANEAYKEGKFYDAIDGYERLIKSGQINGHIYYNLGNAYFRVNQHGKAILNYERARFFIPRDADLRFNLNYAREQIVDVIQEQGTFREMGFFQLEGFTLKEIFWGFAVVNILFWAILLIRLFSRSDWTYYAFIILIIIWFITGFSFGIKYYGVISDERAVIIENEVDILSGPDIADTVLFKLHEGTLVEIERREENWLLVRISKDKRGWIQAIKVERIRGT